MRILLFCLSIFVVSFTGYAKDSENPFIVEFPKGKNACDMAIERAIDLSLEKVERDPIVHIATLAAIGTIAYTADHMDAYSYKLDQLNKKQKVQLAGLMREKHGLEKARTDRVAKGKVTKVIDDQLKEIEAAINRFGIKSDRMEEVARVAKKFTWPLKLGRRLFYFVSIVGYEGYLCYHGANMSPCNKALFTTVHEELNAMAEGVVDDATDHAVNLVYDVLDYASTDLADGTLTGIYLNNPYLITANVQNGTEKLEDYCRLVATYPVLLENVEIMKQIITLYKIQKVQSFGLPDRFKEKTDSLTRDP